MNDDVFSQSYSDKKSNVYYNNPDFAQNISGDPF